MNKVILLGVSDQFSFRAMRIFHLILGVLFIAQGIFHVLGQIDLLRTLFGIFCIGYGAFMAFLSFRINSENSDFAPKVEFSGDIIIFKTGVYKKGIRLRWKDIKSIELLSYSLTILKVDGSSKEIRYKTTPEISQEVKRNIREQAGINQVQVVQ